jgi:hypothetical protein
MLDQIVTADDVIALTDQEFQQIEDLRLDRNFAFSRAQFAAGGIEYEIIE